MSNFFPPIRPMTIWEKLGLVGVAGGIVVAFGLAAGGAGYHFGSSHEKNAGVGGITLPDCRTETAKTVISNGHTYNISCQP